MALDPAALPAFVTGGEADRMIADLAALRECTDLRPLS